MAQINSETSSDESRFSIKKPKRVLHFSDGTVEEFSDSEEEITEPDTTVATPPTGWGPWLLFKLRETGTTTLNACDYVGEALASFLGITSPKYEWELEEYKRMVKEKEKEEEMKKGWSTPSDSVENEGIQTEQPNPTPV